MRARLSPRETGTPRALRKMAEMRLRLAKGPCDSFGCLSEGAW